MHAQRLPCTVWLQSLVLIAQVVYLLERGHTHTHRHTDSQSHRCAFIAIHGVDNDERFVDDATTCVFMVTAIKKKRLEDEKSSCNQESTSLARPTCLPACLQPTELNWTLLQLVRRCERYKTTHNDNNLLTKLWQDSERSRRSNTNSGLTPVTCMRWLLNYAYFLPFEPICTVSIIQQWTSLSERSPNCWEL